ncbi:MAG: hypothetical protein C0483_14495 [Pirellula sp.]|nr:hypothetical protein [Pirellula sp.]
MTSDDAEDGGKDANDEERTEERQTRNGRARGSAELRGDVGRSGDALIDGSAARRRKLRRMFDCRRERN